MLLQYLPEFSQLFLPVSLHLFRMQTNHRISIARIFLSQCQDRVCGFHIDGRQEHLAYPRFLSYLKVSRLIKRRTVANEACDAGRVSVNGKPAKASVNVKVGDIIEIAFGTKTVKVRVLDLLDTTKKEQAKDLFEYIA